MSEIAKMIAQIELRLRGLGYDERKIATDICKPAGVNAHTWRRWRNGEHEPNMATWRRVEREFNGILARRRRKKAARVR
jgi:hypothetical protein